MKWKYLTILVCCIHFTGFSQIKESRIGVNLGVTTGFYFPSNNEAQFYNGSPYSRAKLDDVLFSFSNYTIISEELQDDFTIYEYPLKMKYTPNLSIGGTLQNYLSESLAIYTTISMVNLKANGVYVLKLNSPSQGALIDENAVNGTITGSESRFNFDFGFHGLLQSKTKFIPFIEAAISGSILQVKEHTVSIGTFTQSMQYSENLNTSKLFSTVGYGLQLGTGIQFPVSNKFYVYSGITISGIKYKLVESSMSLQKAIDIKFLF